MARPWPGHGAQAVRDAIAASITTRPQQLRRSLTWDQGAAMAQHAKLRIDADLDIYFAAGPPGQPLARVRVRNENTNGRCANTSPKAETVSRAAGSSKRPRRGSPQHSTAGPERPSTAKTPSRSASTSI